MKVEIEEQVVRFVAQLAPEPRRALRLALHALEKGKGDTQPLEKPLEGYWRLRIMGYRVIFRHDTIRGENVIRCVFAERRSLIYEMFTQELLQQLGRIRPSRKP
jgi:mRNA-degrading endonuclease RelE of RelBE toxin-antitoxin system